MQQTIRRNSYDLIRNLDTGTNCSTWFNLCYFREIDNIIYIKLDWWIINYSNSILDSYKNSWKTILIEWWDLIIDEDIDVSWIMWIVVLKDWDNWGNILVDYDVLNINAIMYSDRALVAYDSNINNRELILDDWDYYFSNQLYIKWSLFSNNTIWWARAIEKICPYYVADASCSITEAQKYDLNYIRRYFRYDHDNNIATDKIVANSGSGSIWISIDYIDYPFVIEYNPLIQITPPPLFTK